MYKKDYAEKIKEIKTKSKAGEIDDVYMLARKLIKDLYKDKNYQYVCDVYNLALIKDKSKLYSFEVAYSLVDSRFSKEAEPIYEFLLKNNPKDSAILNNLSNIKQSQGNINEAWDLIQKAYALAKNDEIIGRNYQNIKSIIDERWKIDAEFQSATIKLSNENEFVIKKLSTFYANSRRDKDFGNGEIPIPSWKFRVLMETDSQKADMLRDHWLERNYIRKTDKRGDYNEFIYQLNPYLENALQTIAITKLPENWVDGIKKIDKDNLVSLGYFDLVTRINKVRKKYRQILLRDVDEMFLNYLMKNKKAVITLAGSIVETVLIYYCEKKGLLQITYSQNQKQWTKRLYDTDLGDLLSYFEQNGILSDILVHMGNISRISRNFIHPGKELRDYEEVNQAKVELCFISAIEIIKYSC
jgi:hypothetical protein